MRPLSVVSDLKEAIMVACAEAAAADLETDQIADIVRETLAEWEAETDALDNARLFQSAFEATPLLTDPLTLQTEYGPLIVQHYNGRGGAEALVIRASTNPRRPTLVRLQSSCIFGEVFHATGCDCAAQLQSALKRIVQENGMLVYCQEEGRGAGLRNKVLAMLEQQRDSLDTVEAYKKLGMQPDLRTYELASHLIRNVLREHEPVIRLITNNKDKANKLTRLGIVIESIEPAGPGAVALDAVPELITKREKLGHLIPLEVTDSNQYLHCQTTAISEINHKMYYPRRIFNYANRRS